MRTLIGLALVLWTVGAEAVPVGPLSVYLVEPCRFVDTRTPQPALREARLGDQSGPLRHDETRFYLVQESCEVPPASAGAILNVTVTDATAPGHLAVSMPGPVATTSTINFGSGLTIANGAIVKLRAVPPGGQYADLRVYANIPGGTAHLVLDVIGYLK